MKPASFLLSSLILAVTAASLTCLHADAEEAASPVSRFELSIRNRRLESAENTIRVTQGDTVELIWTSDEKARLHLHGYDIEFDVTPRQPTIIRFEARATGRYPVTSHGYGDQHEHGHQALLYLEVHPD